MNMGVGGITRRYRQIRFIQFAAERIDAIRNCLFFYGVLVAYVGANLGVGGRKDAFLTVARFSNGSALIFTIKKDTTFGNCQSMSLHIQIKGTRKLDINPSAEHGDVCVQWGNLGPA